MTTPPLPGLVIIVHFLLSPPSHICLAKFGETHFLRNPSPLLPPDVIEVQALICCTLRSGLHEIPTMIRTFPRGWENNHAWKWISDNFPGITHMSAFLEKGNRTNADLRYG